MSGIATITVGRDEAGMRLDRWFKSHYPDLAFGRLQKLVRTGQVRVDGGRVKTSTRLEPGQMVRVPPLTPPPGLDAERDDEDDGRQEHENADENAEPDEEAVFLASLPGSKAARARAKAKALAAEGAAQPATGKAVVTKYGTGRAGDAETLRSMLLYEDRDVYVFNKPFGLAVQGGSGLTRHIDGMLESLLDSKGQKPRLVHRLDRDTTGVLVVARTRLAATHLTAAFRARSTRKVYWALVKGVPKPNQGRISTFLAKGTGPDGERMRIARHGEDDAVHAVTYYAVVDQAGQQMSWLSLRPVTGRTHQLRAHTAHIGHPIVGDPKYFEVENWELPGGIQNRLHLHARRITLPHPSGTGKLDVSAPLPDHMKQSWNLLGFDATQYDPIEEAPDE
ncbi:RluA family pseudouridine synthase [Pseudoxanthobacter sp. M-2]|uniref:RluA family pseudouridine synthase n=1 Tax=Pseudoxanthobacter sp. M-2 TaxID=3078754 RepID=UPI0038FBFBA5